MKRIPPNAKIKPSAHFIRQMQAKGITKAQLMDALTNPYKVTDVTRYPGQERYCGRGVDNLPGIAVIVSKDNGIYNLITLYLDGVVTAMRPDQMNDPYARSSRRLNK